MQSRRNASLFTRFASATARCSGRPVTFVLAFLVIVVWGVTGPLFHYSDTWQLVINTGTTIVTFLMVFLIQNTQNRDSNALHAKLDELIRISEAHNSFIGIENLSDEELEEILAECDKNSTRLRDEARKEVSARQSKPAAHKPARRRTATKRSAKAA